MSIRIERTLIYKNPGGTKECIRQDEILAFREPVVILGDPGLGKSVLTEFLGEQSGMRHFRAGTFVHTANPSLQTAETDRVIVDGLDEIASAVPGASVDAVLKQLSQMSYPPFILSCREADWLGAADRVRIKDDYGVAPVLLHLQPFTRDDARTFLSQEFPEVDAADLLDQLADRGIEVLYENPLTLRMLGEVVQESGVLPDTRVELFDRACRVMLKEPNPHHQMASHAQRRDEELLLAAGAICAAQLLCDRVGVYKGPSSETPDGFLHIADITDLPHGQAASDARRTRLFRAAGENRFESIHRVIAEFLGARWIARCFEDGRSEKRIFALFRQGEGVPTSLRGLHAWIAHFSDALAGRCIASDPYAVLQHGAADMFGLDRARDLLASLKMLSEEDPYFRSGDWRRHSAPGLMHIELRDDILAVIEASGSNTQLGLLLLEAIAGTPLASKLIPKLETIMFDPDRFYRERLYAWEALRVAGVHDDWTAIIYNLLEKKEADSARLACNILNHIGARALSHETVLDTVVAHLSIAATPDTAETLSESRYLPHSIFRDLGTVRLATLLDGLVERARPLFEETGYWAQSDFADLIRGLAIRVLEADPTLAPTRIWSWIGWLDGNRGFNHDSQNRLAAIFRENRALRAALLEHVLLTPCAENAWMAGHLLHDTRLDLFPTSGELAKVLRTLRARAGDEPIDVETFRGLLGLGRSMDGLALGLRDTAAEVANGDPGLLSILDDMSQTAKPEWKTKAAEREARTQVERQRIFHSCRDTLAERASEIAAGDIKVLALPAGVYLGRRYLLGAHYNFDSEASPEDRLYAFLGDALTEQVLAGFIAVLDRDELPDASAIAKIHCESESWTPDAAEAPMICGAAEMLRRSRPIDGIDRSTLAAVYMAWQRAPESNAPGGLEIGSALEAVLFRSEADWETHFRTSIEPQLAHNCVHVSELYRLIKDSRLAGLAGRLAVDWLQRYQTMSYYNEKELLVCALENASHETLRSLVVDRRSKVHPDHDRKLLWLSADYAVDFDGCRVALGEAAAEDREFLWSIRDRVAPDRGDRTAGFSLDQLIFIVEAFGEQWPRTKSPINTVITGDRNPFDATEFIENTIYAIASRPTSEATEALQKLIADHAPSYTKTLKHAHMLQRRARRDFEYTAPTIDELRAVMDEGLPESIDDMRAYFEDRLKTFQERIRGSDTDMWEAYWDGDRPKGENYCRNRMIEHISGPLPQSIRFGPETRMPLRKRVDIALTYNAIKLPVEIKGQWHSEVWNAASDQLDAKYTVDWQAEGRGVYIVLWFGHVPNKQLPGHPDGLARPETPEALRQMLVERLPEARRAWIDVFVIDVSKPMQSAGT